MQLTGRVSRQHLLTARESLDVGDTRSGRRMAHAALARGSALRDTHLQALAYLVLAQAAVYDSRFRLAGRIACRAYELFARHDDAPGQADALALLSYTGSAIGDSQEAVAVARRSIALRGPADSATVQAFGLNYSGVAAFWAGDFGTASGVLEMAAWLVRGSGDAVAGSFHPIVNNGFGEVLRASEAGAAADHSVLARLASQADAMCERGHTGTLQYGSTTIGLLLLEFENCFLASRCGWTGEAHDRWRRCAQRASRLPRSSWLHGVVWWARAECLRACGHGVAALAAAAAMRRAARVGEHLRLEAVGTALQAELRAASHERPGGGSM